ncbi:hypothetical protein GCM10011357_28790 [Lacimicrobium alkaliphilum]|uniref:DUF2780 domain-containing protein n=2 Tax=Lacimicrobium alkaliphilum TaxID=1526571 RepID=A0ABQ1RLA4_9ALTE|nr:hypothetical protein GCM10011357_28790 [Lacimicrobium alkaliphilum]
MDTLKGWFGMEAHEASPSGSTEVPDINQLVATLTRNLDVSTEQAEGGLGALLGYVEKSLSSSQFEQLSQLLPGVKEMISSAPDVSNLKSAEGLDSLIDSISEHNDLLKSINEVKKQFNTLGLSTEQIGLYIQQLQQYLDSEQGQQIRVLINKGLGQLGYS